MPERYRQEMESEAMAAKSKSGRRRSASTNRNTAKSRSRSTSQSKNRSTSQNKNRNTDKNKGRSGGNKQASGPLAREIAFLVILVFGILSLMSLFHMCGLFGEYLGDILFGLFGALAYIFPLYLIVASGLFLSNPNNKKLRRRILLSIGLYWCLCALFQWVVNDPVKNVWEIYSACRDGRGGGGFLGGILSFELSGVLGRGGSLIVILALLLLFFMLISGKLFFASLKKLYEERDGESGYVDYADDTQPRVAERQMNTYTFAPEEEKESAPRKTKRARRKPKATAALEEILPQEQAEDSAERAGNGSQDIHIIRGGEDRQTAESGIYREELARKFGTDPDGETAREAAQTAAVDGASAGKPEKTEKAGKAGKREKTVITAEDEKEMAKLQQDLSKAAAKEIPYQFPSLDLLNRPRGGKKGMNNEELKNTALKLQETLESFGVRVRLGDISLGPSVTRYELIPEQGVKVSRITSLSDDIKLSLAASDIRIEAPIPGKAAVGIEVPNPERTTITLRELLESQEFTRARSKVTFAVGKDISGKTIVTDIAKMPHLLIAGATGSGKSVLINTLIMSILYKADPNEVKMIMVDPKMVELTAYEDIPHLMIPVVKDPKKASAALGWAVAEMTARYQKFAEAGVRDIKSYNAKIGKTAVQDDPARQKMPQIVIIVDELADLMMVAPSEVEDSIVRLSQLARAAGIHLVLATQRPSVNVITGLIKANIPSRIALSVSSAVDSRTIIDSGGAEKLLGNGDMLFAPQNLPKPIRVQGAFVSDEERDGVVRFLKNNGGGPSYDEEVTAHIDSAPVPGAKAGGNGAPGGGPEQDELFAEAGMFIIEKEKASIGLLQRMFRIGFNRAARIMDQLADAGVVGPEEGTKARQIQMSREEFEAFLEGREE